MFASSTGAEPFTLSYDLRVHDSSGKMHTISNIGDYVILDLYAILAPGNDANPLNDGLQSGAGSFVSSTGGLNGDLSGYLNARCHSMPLALLSVSNAMLMPTETWMLQGPPSIASLATSASAPSKTLSVLPRANSLSARPASLRPSWKTRRLNFSFFRIRRLFTGT